jgi:hypothetical protein
MATGVERDKARAAKLQRAALRGHVSARDCWRSITFTLGVSPFAEKRLDNEAAFKAACWHSRKF